MSSRFSLLLRVSQPPQVARFSTQKMQKSSRSRDLTLGTSDSAPPSPRRTAPCSGRRPAPMVRRSSLKDVLTKMFSGERIGQYSYIDQDGQTITVRYSAGKDGFRYK